jgi:hypothetical protein
MGKTNKLLEGIRKLYGSPLERLRKKGVEFGWEI